MDKREAWKYGLGMAQIDGVEPSKFLLNLIAKELKGEITMDDVECVIRDRYCKEGVNIVNG